MSTQKQNMPQAEAPKLKDVRVAIVAAEWNAHINDSMVDSALAQLKANGLDADSDVTVMHVPGAVELTFAASQLIEASLFDVVIVFGTVIRGGTPHFDYVCQSVTQGITALNADCDIPVIFGVLTVDKEEDAIARIDGTVGDKGAECADAALKMVAFQRAVGDL